MNSSSQAPRFQVRLNWKLVLFALVFLPLLTGLGVWQLQRAEEKRTIQESWTERQALAPVPFAELDDSERQEFRRVSLEGEFDHTHYWLMENRVVQGQLGYEVLMPFYLDRPQGNTQIVIVNRGWVPIHVYGETAPQPQTPAGSVRITGSLVEPSDNRFIEASDEQPQSWPAEILEADLQHLESQLQAADIPGAVYDRVLRIDADSPAALEVNWQPINSSAAKHHGYAVQWFAMAVALVILSIFANSNLADVLFKRKKS